MQLEVGQAILFPGADPGFRIRNHPVPENAKAQPLKPESQDTSPLSNTKVQLLLLAKCIVFNNQPTWRDRAFASGIFLLSFLSGTKVNRESLEWTIKEKKVFSPKRFFFSVSFFKLEMKNVSVWVEQWRFTQLRQENGQTLLLGVFENRH